MELYSVCVDTYVRIFVSTYARTYVFIVSTQYEYPITDYHILYCTYLIAIYVGMSTILAEICDRQEAWMQFKSDAMEHPTLHNTVTQTTETRTTGKHTTGKHQALQYQM